MSVCDLSKVLWVVCDVSICTHIVWPLANAIFVAAPVVMVAVTPQVLTIPTNYSESITCVGMVSASLIVDKVFLWTRDSEDVTNSTTPPSNPQGIESSSVAIVQSSTPGKFTYACLVSVTVPGDDPVSAQSSSTITVPSKWLACLSFCFLYNYELRLLLVVLFDFGCKYGHMSVCTWWLMVP